MDMTSDPAVFRVMFHPRMKNVLQECRVSFFDVKGKSAILSRTWEAFGCDESSFFNMGFLETIHADDRKSAEEHFRRLKQGETDLVEGLFRFMRGDETTWLSLRFKVVEKDGNGLPLYIVAHDDDITSLTNAQEEIRERTLEVDSLRDLLFSINKSLDFDETIHKIIDHLHRIIPFDHASVQSLVQGCLKVIGGYGYDETELNKLTFPVRGIDNPATRAIASRRPIICNDVRHEFGGFVQMRGEKDILSWLGIPLVFDGRVIGLFALDSTLPGFYNDRHVRVASTVAEHIAIAVEHAIQHTQVKEEARTDSLTGACNRYGLETEGQDIFYRASREDSSLGVLMIDIDHFKDVNDKYGHAYGDQVLKAVSASVSQNLRAADFLVRYGGEEFLVLLPETSVREALVVAERLKQVVPDTYVDGTRKCPTISIGIFSGVPSAQDFLHEFIRRADLALYEAKEAGRNRCRVWIPNPEYFDKQG